MAKFCTECGAALSEGAKFCKSCGAGVKTEQSARSAAQQAPALVCPGCGRPCAPGTAVCPACGSTVTPADRRAPESAQPARTEEPKRQADAQTPPQSPPRTVDAPNPQGVPIQREQAQQGVPQRQVPQNPQQAPQNPQGYPQQQVSSQPQGYPQQTPQGYSQQVPQQPQGYPQQTPQGYSQQVPQNPQGYPQQVPQQPQGYPQQQVPQQPQGYPQQPQFYAQQIPQVAGMYGAAPVQAAPVKKKKKHGCLIAFLIFVLLVGVFVFTAFYKPGFLLKKSSGAYSEASLESLHAYAQKLEEAGNPEAAAAIYAKMPQGAGGELIPKAREEIPALQALDEMNQLSDIFSSAKGGE